MYLNLMLIATLSLPNLNVEVNGKECVIKRIEFSYIHSYIHAVGNCDFIYEKCLEDKCDVEPIKDEDLNFGKKFVG